MFGLPYTICFCISGDSVLMLRRVKSPNAGKWNGVGGKIEAGETPLDCVLREVFEETALPPGDLEDLRYAGVVTWNTGADPTRKSLGMHAFVAKLTGPAGEPVIERETREGRLAWKPLDWVCDSENEAVVSNIPRFLPEMLAARKPLQYRCEYDGESLVRFYVRDLDAGYNPP